MLSPRETRDVTEELASALAQKLRLWQPTLLEELATWFAVSPDDADMGASPGSAGDGWRKASEGASSFVEAVSSFIVEWLAVRNIEEPEFGVIATAAEKRAMEMLEEARSEA